MSTDKDVKVFLCDVGSHPALQEAQELLICIEGARVGLALGVWALEAELPGSVEAQYVKVLLSAPIRFESLKLPLLVCEESHPKVTLQERDWNLNQKYIGPDRVAQRRYQDQARRGRRNR